METLTEHTVVKRIKQGEIDHFSFIVKKHAARIENYIKSKLFNKEDSEDLTQNVFINFYKAIPRFDEKKPVLPYLFEIAHNELKMYYRSHKSMAPLKEEILVADNSEETMDENILSVLGKNEKKILMEIAEGYSYEELAKRYKISVNTLKSKIRRARLKIRKIHEKD